MSIIYPNCSTKIQKIPKSYFYTIFKYSIMAIESIIEEVNERLPDYARIGSHVIASSPFSVISGELAVSGSPCRAAIEEHYSAQINNQPEVQNEQFFRASPG